MTATTSERVIEERIAELKANLDSKQRELKHAQDMVGRAYTQAGSPPAPPGGVEGLLKEVDLAERALLAAQAHLERQGREQADTHAAAMLAANEEMAKASRAAAASSEAAARAAKHAAIWTAVAAIVTTIGTAIAWFRVR
jgi:hypothetical protein